jgi:hypothetical protein
MGADLFLAHSLGFCVCLSSFSAPQPNAKRGISISDCRSVRFEILTFGSAGLTSQGHAKPGGHLMAAFAGGRTPIPAVSQRNRSLARRYAPLAGFG